MTVDTLMSSSTALTPGTACAAVAAKIRCCWLGAVPDKRTTPLRTPVERTLSAVEQFYPIF